MSALWPIREHTESPSSNDGIRSLLSALTAHSPDGLAGSAEKLRDQVARVLRWRRAQRQAFPEAVLRGPCWDIMLRCMAAELAGHPACIKQIRNELRESQTSILRRIDELEEAGMLRRLRDQMDGRRTLIRLTAEGAAAMSGFFATIEDPAG